MGCHKIAYFERDWRDDMVPPDRYAKCGRMFGLMAPGDAGIGTDDAQHPIHIG
jgi:hypothetical protein